VNAETVGKEKGLPGSQIRGDILLVGGRLFGIRNSHHDHVGKADRLSGVMDRKSIVLGHLAALAAWIQANDDLAAAVFKIEGMGVTLRAEAEHGEGFALKNREIGILVGVDFGGHGLFAG
jgi:hypothetical protein